MSHGVSIQDPRDIRSVSGSVCDAKARNATEDALRLVCRRSPITTFPSFPFTKTIVIGFVGGLVAPDDIWHPEVLFAPYCVSTLPMELMQGSFQTIMGKVLLPIRERRDTGPIRGVRSRPLSKWPGDRGWMRIAVGVQPSRISNARTVFQSGGRQS